MRTFCTINIAFRTIFLILSVVSITLTCTYGQTPTNPQFNIVKPSTTGIPGEEVRIMRLDPSGNLWVGARYPFWGESALAMLPAAQLPYEPLLGGGFDTGAWRVWSSVHHPIPSPYLSDLEFTSDGTVWLASEGGLTRFRPNATNPQEMWHTFTTANSPLMMNSIGSIAVDSQNNVWIANNNVNSANAALFKLNTATNQWTQIPISVNGSTYKPYNVYVGNNDRIFVSLKSSGGFAEFNGASWQIRQPNPDTALGELLQDAQGNVWATTGEQGVLKWNGTSFQRWETMGGTSTITGLGKDRNGAIYVLTWYGPVYKMAGDTPVLFADADNIPSDFIGHPNGEIWINNYGGNGTLGTVRHYTESGQLLERFNAYNSGLHDYFVNRIESDSMGNMWFAAGEGGLTRMSGSDGASTSATHWRNWGNHNDQSEPYPWAGNEPMSSVFEDSNGIFWMGGNGIGRWNSNTGQFTNFWNWQNSNIDTSQINSIVKRGETVWAGSGGSGAYWLNAATGQWTRVWLHPAGGPFQYSANNVKAMAVDTQNNLWLASEFGLRKFEPGNNSTFTLYHNENSGLPLAGLYDVEADPNGGIWVATGAGLVRYDGSSWTLYNQQNTGMPGTYVYDVARRASDGLIAIASNQIGTAPYTGGVSTFNGQTWTHYTTANSPLTHLQVMAVEFDRNGNLWASTMSQGVVQIMIGNRTAARRTPFDFDGDGKSDISVFRPSTGTWYLSHSSNNAFTAVQFGANGDLIAPADYDGDGKTDICVFRPSDGGWYRLNSSNNTFTPAQFGANGDLPVPGDFDGDGKADLTVYRPSAGSWFRINSSNNQFVAAQFGVAEDKPLVGDFDGDGKSDLTVFRPSNGTWYRINSATDTFSPNQFGATGDLPVAADYDGDGKTDLAVYRPSAGDWYIINSGNSSFTGMHFGNAEDKPVPADYDGDGKADLAVFRPTAGSWYLLRTTAGFTGLAFGVNEDVPTPNAFVR